MADVVVMNKLDTATPELVADFQTWANGLFPPKLLIAGTTHGRLDPAWLDLTASDERLPLYPEAHEHETATNRSADGSGAVEPLCFPTPGRGLGAASARRTLPLARPASGPRAAGGCSTRPTCSTRTSSSRCSAASRA